MHDCYSFAANNCAHGIFALLHAAKFQ